MTTRVEVTGVDTTISSLENARDELKEVGIIYSREAMEAFIEDLSDYPPESEANQPPAPFWIRGTGLATNNDGSNINPQSQKLIANWVIAQDSREDESIVIGRNSAGYAPWVHGSHYQAGFHERRNWSKAEEVSKRLGIPVQVIESPNGYPPVTTNHSVDVTELNPIILNPIMAIIERLRNMLSR